MQARMKKPICKFAFFAACAFWIAGCQTPAVKSVAVPGADRSVAQAERLARQKEHAPAAQAFEESAARQNGDLRNRLLLRAAREWARASDLSRAQALLQQIGEQLPPAELTLRRIVAAEVALLAHQPDRALSELERIPAPPSRQDAPEILALRSRALFAYGRPLGAVLAALDREQLLNSATDIESNRRMVWDGIVQNAASGANLQAPPGASRTAAGWLELGRAALALSRNPFAAQTPITEWRAKYPEHPANELLNRYVLPQLDASLVYPEQIALLLPLSGPQQTSGAAVRDGFLAAALQHQDGRRPTIRIYDTVNGAAAAHRQALADGARFVVGPLIKEDIAQVLTATTSEAAPPIGAPSAPMLALNSALEYAPNSAANGATAASAIYQFALDPTDEAEQAAERAIADGKRHAAILSPNNEWGQRVSAAFSKRFTDLGGAVAASQGYDPASKDYSDPVKTALLINESLARAAKLSALLGIKIETEPRVRADIDVIFLASEPAPGRLIIPTLRFNLVSSLPIYAISNIFDPDSTANAELNGVMFTDIPWIIAPDDAAAQMRQTLAQYWPARMRGARSRLFAFGFDAYRLIPALQAHTAQLAASALPGMTGMLSIDSTGRVHRQLEWARILDGRALPIATPAVAAQVGAR